MMTKARTWSAVAIALAVIAAHSFVEARGRKPLRTEPVGNFAILTWESKYTTGWNEGRVRRATTENHTIHYSGRPFRFTGKGGNFTDVQREYDENVNTAITFAASEPAIVVNVGDPANRSFFFLLREVDGAPRADLLGEDAGSPEATWIPPHSGPAPVAHRLGPHRLHFEGGRFLLLGRYTVLDTLTLASYTVDPPLPAHLKPHIPVLTASPDGNSFVRLGEENGEPRLIVFDFVSRHTDSLPIERRVMRYSNLESIDAAWIDHHFRWSAEAGSHERLMRREHFAPLPHRGRLAFEQSGSYREYRIEPVSEDIQAEFVAFLVKTMDAELLPRGEYAQSDSLRIEGRTVHVWAHRGHLGVWMDRGTDSSLVATIAEKADGMLATGAWDAFFVP